MSEPISIDQAQYWKLRTRLAEHQRVVDRCNADVMQSKAVLDQAMVDAGLDPAQRYQLSDDECSAMVESPVSLPGPNDPDGR